MYLFLDVQLSNSLSDDDRVSNIELFRRLCAENICTSVFALRIDDFFFCSDDMKNNFLALLCEIFVKMESSDCGQFPSDRSIKHDNTTELEELVHIPQKLTPELNRRNKKDQQTFEQKEPQQTHLPLLSKRSKHQLAMFETSLTRDVQSLSKGKPVLIIITGYV